MTYTSTNLMDKWIVSFTQSLLSFVHEEMDREWLYPAHTIIPWGVHLSKYLITHKLIPHNDLHVKSLYRSQVDCCSV